MQQLSTEQVLARLGRLRAGMPLHRIPPRLRRRCTERPLDVHSIENFDGEAVAEALGTMADEVHALVETVAQTLVEQALDVYYALEELVRDPEHAHLLPHLENMRNAYEQSYGCAVPTKEETERRRAEERAAV
jgi:hypothetical protein